jgi:hypothetical protein
LEKKNVFEDSPSGKLSDFSSASGDKSFKIIDKDYSNASERNYRVQNEEFTMLNHMRENKDFSSDMDSPGF